MMYSCAYFPREGADLEEAQLAKLDRICERLRARPGQPPAGDRHRLGRDGDPRRARRTGCRVTTTTISRAQHELATERVREAGLSDRITVLLEDYRDLERHLRPAGLGRDDRGGRLAVLRRLLPACDRLLADDGLLLLQAITIDDRLYEVEKASRSFANTHVFPGGCLPSMKRIADSCRHGHRACARSGSTTSPRTTRRPWRAWRERFFSAWDRLRAPRLRRALPSALGLLPELLRGGLPRAPDRRRPGPLREAAA